MTPEQYAKELAKKQTALKRYVANVFPRRAGSLALLFIRGNFMLQGWRGGEDGVTPWKPLAKKRPGKILIRTGRLMRGTHFTTEPGVAHIVNDTPYTAAHNNGAYGVVHVRAHQRKKFKVKTVDTGRLTAKGKHSIRTVYELDKQSFVKAHDRKMNLPQRKFMPTRMSDSPQFANVIKGEIMREIKTIFGTAISPRLTHNS